MARPRAETPAAEGKARPASEPAPVTHVRGASEGWRQDQSPDAEPAGEATVRRFRREVKSWLNEGQNENTAKTYATYRHQYESFLKENAVGVSDTTAARFLQQLSERGLKGQTVSVAKAAIADAHRYDETPPKLNTPLTR